MSYDEEMIIEYKERIGFWEIELPPKFYTAYGDEVVNQLLNAMASMLWIVFVPIYYGLMMLSKILAEFVRHLPDIVFGLLLGWLIAGFFDNRNRNR